MKYLFNGQISHHETCNPELCYDRYVSRNETLIMQENMVPNETNDELCVSNTCIVNNAHIEWDLSAF